MGAGESLGPSVINYHDVIPLLFEAFPDIHAQYLGDAERNGLNTFEGDDGRPLTYPVFGLLLIRQYVWAALERRARPVHGAQQALAFADRIAREGDKDARDLVYIEVAEVFAENLAVRRLMGSASQAFAMHRAAVIRGAAYSHVLQHDWRGYRMDSAVKDRVREWLPRRAEAVVAEARARLREVGLPDVPPTLEGRVWDWPAADLRAERFPEQLRIWLQSARDDLATGHLRRAKGEAAFVLEGVREWEQCKVWGLV